jgi:hypothetical protein
MADVNAFILRLAYPHFSIIIGEEVLLLWQSESYVSE